MNCSNIFIYNLRIVTNDFEFSDKKSADPNEMRFMRRRIRTLQRINDALRTDLKNRRSSESRSNVEEKTDVRMIERRNDAES